MRVRRAIFRLSVLLVVGMITSYVVALVGTMVYPYGHAKEWIASDGSTCSKSTTPFRSVTYAMVRRGKVDRAPDQRVAMPERINDRSFFEARIVELSTPEADPGDEFWFVYHSGWPWTSSWGWSSYDATNISTRLSTSGLASVPMWNPPPRMSAAMPEVTFPILPRVRGLIANGAFYASLWWVVLFTPRVIRRAIRSRRGACVSCGYDMRNLQTCPECGHARRLSRARNPHARPHEPVRSIE